MRLRRHREEPDVTVTADLVAEARAEDAQRTVARLAARADRVARSLTERQERNHWGETVARIARREV